jgi:hypothetical protein
MLIIGHSVGWTVYGPNFLESVRDSSKTLNADVMAGHRAATLVHLANIGASAQL